MIECTCEKWPDWWKEEAHEYNCPFTSLGDQW